MADFEYQINVDHFAAAQSLYHKARLGWGRIRQGLAWILIGLFFMLVGCNERPTHWSQVLIAGLGVYWVYCGALRLSLPKWYFRRHYRGSGLSGKTFKTHTDETGFHVDGDAGGWSVKWCGVTLKREDKSVFMLYSLGTIFIFGKQYLTAEMQDEIRRLSGLSR